MPNGPFSKVPWPGNSWCCSLSRLPFWAPQQPHKHPHSLQLAIHTQLVHHYIQYALLALSAFCHFLSPREFLQSIAWAHQSTEMALERAASNIKETHPPCFFWLLPWENVTTPMHSIWVTSFINYSWVKLPTQSFLP